jgi:plasmid stabilization system protein ParE
VRKPFVLTPTAKADLREILLDLAEDSPDAARSLLERFQNGFQTLGRTPGLGHYHDELLSRKYRFWNLHPYVVVYAWEASPIQIISIVHGARDLAAFLTSREETA